MTTHDKSKVSIRFLRKEQRRLEDEVRSLRNLLAGARQSHADELGAANAKLRRANLRTQVMGDTASAASAALRGSASSGT